MKYPIALRLQIANILYERIPTDSHRYSKVFITLILSTLICTENTDITDYWSKYKSTKAKKYRRRKGKKRNLVEPESLNSG